MMVLLLRWRCLLLLLLMGMWLLMIVVICGLLCWRYLLSGRYWSWSRRWLLILVRHLLLRWSMMWLLLLLRWRMMLLLLLLLWVMRLMLLLLI